MINPDGAEYKNVSIISHLQQKMIFAILFSLCGGGDELVFSCSPSFRFSNFAFDREHLAVTFFHFVFRDGLFYKTNLN